jgi:hypothetical protein
VFSLKAWYGCVVRDRCLRRLLTREELEQREILGDAAGVVGGHEFV